MRIAFDIGGTFTDFVLQNTETGQLHLGKVPTTSADLAAGVLSGLAELLERAGVEPGGVSSILHATTIATNAVIERKGAPTALITTKGFRDVVIIGRQKRYETYDLYLDKPRPLVRRRDVFEVAERTAHDGAVLVPLDEVEVEETVAALVENGYRSIAVALLHAYADPAHERAIGAAIAARAPDLAVSLSSDVSPKFREYERISTTVANAYVKPIVGRYLDDLGGELKGRGLESDIFIMQSNGGLVSPEIARDYPIHIVESGPAAGVLMGAVVARQEGVDHVLTFDMGGTTAKLGAIDDGEPSITPTFEVDQVRYRKSSGLPLNISAVELLEIGAGGGSIAGLEMGLIKVGPESAGAEPGPICYAAGGTRSTVTDANLVLGYLNADYFNGGAMPLDAEAAAAGIERDIGKPLELETGEAAWGIHAMANGNMERAMRIVSIERGRDPRKYALVVFGGAGPLHAGRLARALGTVIVPFGAGVGSAVGLLEADAKIDVSMTRVIEVTPETGEAFAEVYCQLEVRAQALLARLGTPVEPRWLRYAYMRYAGQGFELRVALPPGPIDDAYAAKAVGAFEAVYEQSHGYRDPSAKIEAVDWDLVATWASGATLARYLSGADEASAADAPTPASRQAYFPEAGGFVDCTVVNRYRMKPGDTLMGPAIIEEREATTVLLPGDVVAVSPRGHLVIAIKGAEAP